MITALDDTGTHVIAREATKTMQYYCPECERPLIFRKGEIKIPHFAHKTNDDVCYHGKGETQSHIISKYHVYDVLRKLGFHTELEHRINVEGYGHVVADVLCLPFTSSINVFDAHKKDAIAFEIQKSNITTSDVVTRTAMYNSVDVVPLWLLPKDKDLRRNFYWNMNYGQNEFRLRKKDRVFFHLHGNKIFLLDTSDFDKLGITSVTTHDTLHWGHYHDEEGEEIFREWIPKTIKAALESRPIDINDLDIFYCDNIMDDDYDFDNEFVELGLTALTSKKIMKTP
jgi:competence protein CoiA